MNAGKRFVMLVWVCLTLVWSSQVNAMPNKTYNIMATESIIIKFDSPIKRALVANPDLASLKVINSKELLVSGKQSGRTDLIVWYQNTPNEGHNIVLNVSPDASRREEISKTVSELISQLDPDKTVNFELKNIWIDSNSSVRRELDNLGNQIDDDGTLQVEAGKNKDILQKTQKVGRLNIHPIAGNYMVLLKGTVPYKARKKRIQAVISTLGLSVVNMIKVKGRDQVKLSVRVAEVSKGNPFRSGMAVRDKKDRFGIFPPGNLGAQALFSLNNSPSNSAGIAFPHADAFQLGFNPQHGSIFGVLSVLEGHNLARVLAKPELVVQSGETASFLVGGEVPIPTAQNQNTITVTYKEYGIRLRFSPIITEGGNIQLTVAPEVSNIDESSGANYLNIVVPGFKSRKANTTITLAPGQSFVIGGLLSDNLRSQINKVPLLGDIPILGSLFRSTSYEEDKSELAILVTPTLVDPIGANKKVILPGENVTRASTFDGFFLGKIAKVLPQGESALPKSMVKIGLETVE